MYGNMINSQETSSYGKPFKDERINIQWLLYCLSTSRLQEVINTEGAALRDMIEFKS